MMHLDFIFLIYFAQDCRDITQNTNIKDVFQEINLQNCMLVKKCLQGQTGSYVFNKYFEIQNNGRHTRNENCSIKLKPIKLEVSRQSFYYNGAKLFNSLPREIRLKRDQADFQPSLLKHKF